MLPGMKFNPTIGFRSFGGGGGDDSLELGKLAKEIKGEVDGSELRNQVEAIFEKNFPEIHDPDIAIRDSRTLLNQLNSMKDLSGEEYTPEV